MYLPNGTTETVDVQVHVRSSEVCNTLGAKIGLREGSMGSFALFKECEGGFCEFGCVCVCVGV